MLHPNQLQSFSRSVLFLLLILVPSVGLAQSATLRGFIKDNSDGQSLQGVNVILRGDAGALFGSATDRDGYYIINQIPPGTYTFLASFIGYETYEETITLAADELRVISVDISPAAFESEEIVIEDEAEGAIGMEVAGLQTVRSAAIERIPTPGLSPDLANYLQTLSGVVAVGDRGGQLFVRGGTPSQNLSLIDGIPIYQPFHVIGFYSAFPADIIHTTDIYAGGFGAQYGNRISSVLDVSTRSGNVRRFAGSASIDPFLGTLQLEGPVVPGYASLLVSARQSIIENTSPNFLDRELPYQFWDRFAKFNTTFNSRSSVSITAMQTHDRGNLSGLEEFEDELPESVLNSEDDQVVWDNEAYGLRFLHVPSSYPILGELLFSFSRLENEFGPPDNPERSSAIQTINSSAKLTYMLGSNNIDTGFFVRNVKLSYNLGGLFQNIDEADEFLTEAGIFMDAALPFSDKIILRPGIRLTSFRGKFTVEPRTRLIFRPGGPDGIHQLSAAWGIYKQDLAGLTDRRDAGDVFTAWVASPVGNKVPEAIHTILGYQIRPIPGVEFAVEGFYKSLDNLLIPEWTSFPRFTTRLQPANGTARGFDVRLEVNRPSFYGYVSYGISEVEYNAMQESLRLWYGSDELAFNPPHDRRHQLNLLGQVDLWGFDLSVRWQMGSGLPFSQSAGFDTFVLLDSLVNVVEEPGDARVLYAEPYGGRLPMYHRLDVSLERSIQMGRSATGTFQLGLINAYDRRNLFYLDIFTLRRINQLPVIPSLGLKVSFQ